LLDRARFSPGEIDGRFGENAKKAMRAYEEAQQLPTSDEIGADVWTKLASDDRPVIMSYTISKKDIAGPFLRKLPAKMEAMKDPVVGTLESASIAPAKSLPWLKPLPIQVPRRRPKWKSTRAGRPCSSSTSRTR
jgi:peptidoglycan hydrolase-like protein with peptidoglycan-binding domain